MEIEKYIQEIINYTHNFAETMLNNGKEYYTFDVWINKKRKLIAVTYQDDEMGFSKKSKNNWQYKYYNLNNKWIKC